MHIQSLVISATASGQTTAVLPGQSHGRRRAHGSHVPWLEEWSYVWKKWQVHLDVLRGLQEADMSHVLGLEELHSGLLAINHSLRACIRVFLI